MDSLPQYDIPMLVSAINFLLRDGEFEDLDAICSYYDISRDDMDAKLASQGYSYFSETNRVG